VTVTGLIDEFVRNVFTDGNGAFLVTSLEPGTYFVGAEGPSPYRRGAFGPPCTVFWCRPSSGTPIIVTNGATRAAVDIVLKRAGAISGRATNADGSPVAFRTVIAVHAISEVTGSASTDASGNYTISSLDEGPHSVLLLDRVLFDGVPCPHGCRLDDGTRVAVVAGQTRTGINFGVPTAPAGSISGLVVNATTGARIGSGIVHARNRSTGASSFAMLQSDGSYALQSLSPGAYSVWAEGFFGSGSRVYGGGPLACDDDTPACAARIDAGSPVVVSAGNPTTGIDILIPQGARVTFHLRDIDTGAPVNGIVNLYSESGLQVLPAPYHNDGNGTNVADHIAPGRYYAVASSLEYESRVYGASQSCPEDACPLTLGQSFELTAGGLLTLQVALNRRNDGSVTGRVTGPDGSVIHGGVGLYYANGGRAPHSATSMNDLSFRFDHVKPGLYYVRTDTFGFLDEWFGDVCVGCGTGMGTPIVVTGGQTTANVDFALTTGSVIHGAINRPNRGFGTRIDVFDAAGTLVVWRLCEDPSPCAYRVEGLAPGDYRVRAMDSEFDRGSGTTTPLLIGQIHPGIDCSSFDCPLDGAAIVTLDAVGPNASARVDFTLRYGGRIRARAIARGREWTGIMPRTFRLQLFDDAGRPAGLKPTFHSESDFVGLPAGTYYLRSIDGHEQGYVDEAWQDFPCSGCPPRSGTPIHVVEGGIVQGIEIVLDPGRALIGTVVDASTSGPLENVTVRVLSAAGVQAGEAVTGPTGAWRVHGLAPGAYFLVTANQRGYVDEVYQDQLCPSCDITRGRAVTMTADADAGPITIALSRAGVVTGSVTDSNAIGIGGVGVELFDGSGDRVARVATRGNGIYHVSVPPGTLYARTEPSQGRSSVLYSGIRCTGGCTPTSGTPISVATGATTANINFTLQGCPSFAFRAQTSAIRYLNTASEETFVPLGGTAPFTFRLLNGVLPTGWSFDAARGVASGVPTAEGLFSFAVGVVDAAGCSTTGRYAINVLGCRVNVGASMLSFASAPSTRELAIGGACAAEVFESADWIQPLPSTITTPTTLQITVRQNHDHAPREAVVMIGGHRLTVRQAGALSSNAFGFVDLPRDGDRVTGAIAIGGWALDDIEVARVQLYRDAVPGEPEGQSIYLGDAVRVRGARPDVEAFFPTYPYRDRAGWGFLLLTNMLPNQGNGSFRVHAYADDIEGHRTLLGSKTIVAENATAVRPFGAIDTPGQGATVFGRSYINFGWVLTPLPKSIPADGATIAVLIDGSVVGTVNYGHFREDIATFFPGLNNSQGAVGYRIIDTTQLADGIHTISWVVTDSAGVTQGIGSRYFHVDNAGVSSGVTSGVTAAAAASAVVRDPAHQIRVYEMGRIQLDLRRNLGITSECPATYTGVEIVGGDERSLPVGSWLDPRTGGFTWQPGPGFVGNYRLSFTATACDGTQTSVPFHVTIARLPR
jgi:hypothetical protein